MHIAGVDTVFPHTALIEVVTYESPDDMAFDNFAAHLKLVFSDVDSPDHPDRMSAGQALLIAGFVRTLHENINTLFVSCEAGMSRSPAIAAAVMLALGGDDMPIWENPAYSPNGYVYRMVLKAFGLDASGTDEKEAVNLEAWDSRLNTYNYFGPSPKDIYYSLIGLCVGDALGVPVEFASRDILDKHPLDDMVGYGTYDKPPGTWSDDTSMAMALADSLANGEIDYVGIMNNFTSWLYDGDYTSDGHTFDVGGMTRRAIKRYSNDVPPLECGGTAFGDNGNGSLMRILPAALFLASKYGVIIDESVIGIIHDLSSMTHAHNISKIACTIYCNIAFHIMNNMRLFRETGRVPGADENRRPFLHQTVTLAVQEACGFYRGKEEYAEDIDIFKRITSRDFLHYKREEIKSSGYVVDTLEAAVWCLLNHDDYTGTVLCAVNLGGDTDTTAAIAGGLAGLLYQNDEGVGIPERWINEIVNIDLVETICNRLSKTLCSDQDYYEYWEME